MRAIAMGAIALIAGSVVARMLDDNRRDGNAFARSAAAVIVCRVIAGYPPATECNGGADCPTLGCTAVVIDSLVGAGFGHPGRRVAGAVERG